MEPSQVTWEWTPMHTFSLCLRLSGCSSGCNQRHPVRCEGGHLSLSLLQGLGRGRGSPHGFQQVGQELLAEEGTGGTAMTGWQLGEG